MPRLVALALPGGPAFVDALRRVWDAGDAAFPLDLRIPPAGAEVLLAAMAPDAVVDETGEQHRRPGGRPVEPGDALVVATSGTTGAPKGVVLTHDAVHASAVATTARLGVAPDTDHWLACLPLAHVGGLSVVTRALATHTALTVLPRPDAALVEDAARRGATLVSLVPTLLGRIDTSLFRRILLGGAAPPDRLPGNVIVTYGSTETGSGVVYDGLPLDGVDVRIDAEDRDRVVVRGPMLLRAYRDGIDPKSADGWLATGDAGRIIDGRLHVMGRLDDVIVTGGENVWPDAVEAVLAAHPAVQEVAVVGRPDPEWGELVVAVVVRRPDEQLPAVGELRDLVTRTLPSNAAPRAVVEWPALPRTPGGKVQRRRVREEIRTYAV